MLSVSKYARLASLFVLSACTQSEDRTIERETVACALDGSETFAGICTLERSGEQLIVHHPDGGFRRFARDDGSLIALDGADSAGTATLAEGVVEVAIAGDSYRIPLDAPEL